MDKFEYISPTPHFFTDKAMFSCLKPFFQDEPLDKELEKADAIAAEARRRWDWNDDVRGLSSKP